MKKTEKDGTASGDECELGNQADEGEERRTDGGVAGWLQVMGSWCVLFSTWGLVNSFGVYQTYYETELLRKSRSMDISWIGSMQGGLLLTGGIVSGPLYDRGYFRHLLVGGLFLIVLGQFLTSSCSAYWQVLLAQGVCTGFGMGMTFLPSTAILSQYFAKRRALASGIASSGSPLAGIILPVVFNRLQASIGFGWASRVIAFSLLGSSMVPILFMKTRMAPQGRSRPVMDRSALKEPAFLMYTVGCLFAFMASYIPFFYIELFTIRRHLADAGLASYMVMMMNAGSLLGRFVPGYFADCVGTPIVMSVCTLAASVLALAWLGICSSTGAVVLTLLYGFFSGGIVSLMPVVVYEISPTFSTVGTRLGMVCFVSGVGVLIGSPIAGGFLGHQTEPRWEGTIGFTAAALLVGALWFCGSVLSTFLGRRAKAFGLDGRWSEGSLQS